MVLVARREEGAYPRRYSVDVVERGPAKTILVGRSPAKTTEQSAGLC